MDSPQTTAVFTFLREMAAAAFPRFVDYIIFERDAYTFASNAFVLH